MILKKSERAFAEARKVLPGGVNSPVRAFKGVGGTPVFMSRGEGAYLYDLDGNAYIDYVGSWGPLILGHNHPEVKAAIHEAVQSGTSFGTPTEVEIELARTVVAAVPSIDMVRFVNSGTEATMSALRLARAYSKRDKIIKFNGCYHGHADMLLAHAGSGVTTLGLPDSPGVPSLTVSDTLIAEYNNLESVQRLFEANSEEIAAVIVEPVAGNMGVVPPADGFLEGLRKLTGEYGALLIFDEVMTGFRVAYGCAQERYGVLPDLTCLGKIIGGGLPVGAYGGRKEIMQLVAPEGPVYQAGTLSGNPLAMTAGLATLKVLMNQNVYFQLEEGSKRLAAGIAEAAEEAGIPVFQTRVGSMQCTFFTEHTVTDFATAKHSDTRRYAWFFHALLTEGVYLAPSQFEAMFVSLAHTSELIDKTLSRVRSAFRSLR